MMTVDEFLAWAEAEEGRYELYHGQVYAMAIHHQRQGDSTILTRLVSEGALRLDPPSLDIAVDGLFR